MEEIIPKNKQKKEMNIEECKHELERIDQLLQNAENKLRELKEKKITELEFFNEIEKIKGPLGKISNQMQSGKLSGLLLTEPYLLINKLKKQKEKLRKLCESSLIFGHLHKILDVGDNITSKNKKFAWPSNILTGFFNSFKNSITELEKLGYFSEQEAKQQIEDMEKILKEALGKK